MKSILMPHCQASTPPRQAAKRKHDRERGKLIAAAGEPLLKLQADWERRLLHAETHPNEDFYWDRKLELIGLQWGQNLGEGQLEGLGIIKTPPSRRTPDQRDRLLDYFLRTAPAFYSDQFKRLELSSLRLKLDALAEAVPHVTRALE